MPAMLSQMVQKENFTESWAEREKGGLKGEGSEGEEKQMWQMLIFGQFG